GMPEAPPVRMVHPCIGNFHRAHQTWYTAGAPAYLDYLRRSEVAVITITVTEVGYLAKSDGGLDRTNDAVQQDTAALRGDPEAPVTSISGRNQALSWSTM
ncbi:MAG TPA: hypothetical protein VFY56_09070, partial [Propionibacteriaceae bacterium]|nr:hypothetical protein [Propionibacteriaceae bacterium]